MKTRWTAGILIIITAITLIAAPAAEARGRRRRAAGHGRSRSSSNVHEDIAAAHFIGALIGLAFLSAAIESAAPAPQPTVVHVCRNITRKEWLPGRYEPYTETRWVPTRRGGYYEEFTAHRWVKGYYHTVTIRDPNCCR